MNASGYKILQEINLSGGLQLVFAVLNVNTGEIEKWTDNILDAIDYVRKNGAFSLNTLESLKK